jgi:hypothetical protein
MRHETAQPWYDAYHEELDKLRHSTLTDMRAKHVVTQQQLYDDCAVEFNADPKNKNRDVDRTCIKVPFKPDLEALASELAGLIVQQQDPYQRAKHGDDATKHDTVTIPGSGSNGPEIKWTPSSDVREHGGIIEPVFINDNDGLYLYKYRAVSSGAWSIHVFIDRTTGDVPTYIRNAGFPRQFGEDEDANNLDPLYDPEDDIGGWLRKPAGHLSVGPKRRVTSL